MKEEVTESALNKILQNSVYGAVHMHDSIPTPTPKYYNSDYEKLYDQISPLCLPDQADKVLYKIIDVIKGYDADDTHRHICDLLMQITRKHVGL
jgi:hypothetical protein